MKTTARLRSAFAVTALACAFFTSSASAQLVNGGFELGNFNGWTLVEPTSNPSSQPLSRVGSDSAFAYNGSAHYANLTADPGLTGTLSQTFNTAAGSLYNVSFALANDIPTGTFTFELLWNNAVVFTLANPAAFNYTVFSANNLVATGSDTIQFRFRHDDDFFRLDQVTANVVPEPSTVSFAVLGLGLFGAFSYRRAKLRRSVGR